MSKVSIKFDETKNRWYVMNQHMIKIVGYDTEQAAQKMADEMNNMDPILKRAMRQAFRNA